MQLYFCRHGKTEWNLEKRFQGKEGNSPLLPESYAEIALLGERLKDVAFSAVYSSPALRAKETAEGIMKCSRYPQPIQWSENLLEIGLGELEGCLIEQAKEKYGQELDALRNNPANYDPSAFGGEPYMEMVQRICNQVEQAVGAHDSGPILFVGHGASLTGGIQFLAGNPVADLRKMGGLNNATLSILETGTPKEELPYRLKMWNDKKIQ